MIWEYNGQLGGLLVFFKQKSSTTLQVLLYSNFSTIISKKNVHFDLFFAGSATFIALSYLSQKWSNGTTRQIVQSNMVTAWACRLGMYLFVRILKDGKDKRFDNVRNNPARYFEIKKLCTFTPVLIHSFFRFFSFWTIQGVWVFVTLLPTLMLNNSSREKPIGTRDYVGWSIYAIGMIFEVMADYQKTAFKNDPNNKVF